MTTPAQLLSQFGLKRAYERECDRVAGFQRVSERFLQILTDARPAHQHVAPGLALYYALRDIAAAPCPQQALDAAVTTLVRELDIVSPDAGPMPERQLRLRQALLAPEGKAA